ncbi:MAG: hypothetical protein R3345_00580 [Fulvivirga sp.]|nr:hypothetical protein [Fulvivirga sp.]
MSESSKNFSKLYALFILFYLGFTDQWFSDLFTGITCVLALTYIFLTYSKQWFLWLVIGFTVTIIDIMPENPNVIFFSLILNLTILWHYLRSKWKDIPFELHSIKKLIIIELSVLYFFAFFHKLNYSFLAIDCSCGTMLTKELIEHIPGFSLPDLFYYFIIYLTLIIELLLPVALLWRKTRLIALIFGLFFHFALARSHYDFSGLIFAIYTLFLPDYLQHQVSRYLKYLSRWWMFLAIMLCILVSWYFSYMFSYRLFMILWFAFAAGYFIMIFQQRKKMLSGLLRPLEPLAMPHVSYYIFILLLIFNGLNPYLGLKTEYSFAMYSNLRTEAGQSNHLLIDNELKLFDFQEDLVFILDTNIEEIQDDQVITYFDFYGIIKSYEGLNNYYIKYKYEDNVTIYNFDGSKEFKKISNYNILDKFLKFRKIQLGSCVQCVH